MTDRELALRQLRQLHEEIDAMAEAMGSDTMTLWRDALADSLHRLEHPAKPPEDCVRVRVAVNVSTDGNWGSYGSVHDSTDEALRYLAPDYGDAVYWIEADLPIPDGRITVVDAKVTP